MLQSHPQQQRPGAQPNCEKQSMCLRRLGSSEEPAQFQDGKPKEARLTTSGLAGETERNVLCEIITLHGSLWLLLGIIRKLINLLCRSNTAVQSVIHPEESHRKKRFHKRCIQRWQVISSKKRSAKSLLNQIHNYHLNDTYI